MDIIEQGIRDSLRQNGARIRIPCATVDDWTRRAMELWDHGGSCVEIRVGEITYGTRTWRITLVHPVQTVQNCLTTKTQES